MFLAYLAIYIIHMDPTIAQIVRLVGPYIKRIQSCKLFYLEDLEVLDVHQLVDYIHER